MKFFKHLLLTTSSIFLVGWSFYILSGFGFDYNFSISGDLVLWLISVLPTLVFFALPICILWIFLLHQLIKVRTDKAKVRDLLILLIMVILVILIEQTILS